MNNVLRKKYRYWFDDIVSKVSNVFDILTVERNNKERRVNMLMHIKLLKIMIGIYNHICI